MTRNVPPRLRAPLRVLLTGSVIVAVLVAARGWAPPVYLVLIPFVLLLAAGYYAWSGRDGDAAAVVRREPDERQEYRRLRAEALVGRVLRLGVAAAALVALAVHAPFWPFAAALALTALATAAGWVLHRDRG
jgi:hypothetical protein